MQDICCLGVVCPGVTSTWWVLSIWGLFQDVVPQQGSYGCAVIRNRAIQRGLAILVLNIGISSMIQHQASYGDTVPVGRIMQGGWPAWSWTLGSAPYSSNRRATTPWSAETAQCRGARPRLPPAWAGTTRVCCAVHAWPSAHPVRQVKVQEPLPWWCSWPAAPSLMNCCRMYRGESGQGPVGIHQWFGGDRPLAAAWLVGWPYTEDPGCPGERRGSDRGRASGQGHVAAGCPSRHGRGWHPDHRDHKRSVYGPKRACAPYCSGAA